MLKCRARVFLRKTMPWRPSFYNNDWLCHLGLSPFCYGNNPKCLRLSLFFFALRGRKVKVKKVTYYNKRN
jgi:hypothetical protein